MTRIPNDPHKLVEGWTPGRRDVWYSAIAENKEAVLEHVESCSDCREKVGDIAILALMPDKLRERLEGEDSQEE
jgi:hypothetical protein